MANRFQPSLKALRSFEAAARLESLTLAAEELNVSVSAIAFQVRQVEAGLGEKLLTRNGRALAATDRGKALARELRVAFAQIDASLCRFRSPALRVVTVSMLPSFASLWLLPRLGSFKAEHPEIEVRILTSHRRVNLDAEQVDFAVRCGPGNWPGVQAELLFPQALAPLCHPDHPGAGKPVVALAQEELIVNSRHNAEWSDWFAASGMAASEPARGQRLDGRELIAEAVNAGLGIGLMDVSIFAKQIWDGQLVQLDAAVHTGWNHYLVSSAGNAFSPTRQAFRDWIALQAEDARSVRTTHREAPPQARTSA